MKYKIKDYAYWSSIEKNVYLTMKGKEKCESCF